jgi:XTP/dITP diphosphohydrolase
MTLILATRNTHKLQEIQAILGPKFTVRSMADFGSAPPLVEDANTFAGNATRKAVQLAEWLARQGLGPDSFVLADDSGLEVDSLNGAPGVHSARFAALDKAANSPDPANNAKLLKLLEGVPLDKRTARFCCVLALTRVPQSTAEPASPTCFASEAELNTTLFEGACEGHIAFAPSGKAGFGYDPLFVPAGFTKSFAELGEAEKNQISHRAHALARLRSYLQSQRGGRVS